MGRSTSFQTSGSFLGLPDLANENTECPVKFQFQILHGTRLYQKKKKIVGAAGWVS